jgi:short-subunit dehydrogenase
MAVAHEILPHFRANRGGVLVNVASMGGRITFPLYSVYHGTKWAVDGFSDSLQFELRPLGIRVKIVEPGAIKTDFYDRSAEVAHNRELSEYNTLVDKATRRMNKAGEKGASPEIVAKAIYRAATDSSWKLRYPVGSDAKSLLSMRRLLPDAGWHAMIRQALLS